MNLQSVATVDQSGWENPNLNLDNLDLLIAHMEAMPSKAFDMSAWVRTSRQRNAKAIVTAQQNAGGSKHACGTTACIAGEAVLLKAALNNPEYEFYSSYHVEAEAREWLGLEYDPSRRLFLPSDYWRETGVEDLDTITRDRAVRVLKYLRATGRVEWDADKRRRSPAPAYVSTMEGKPLPFLAQEA